MILKKFLLKRVSNLSLRNLRVILSLTFLILFVFLVMILGYGIRDLYRIMDDQVHMVIWTCLFIVASFFIFEFFRIIDVFRKEQITWLKEYGDTVFSKFRRVKTLLGPNEYLSAWIIETESDGTVQRRIYRSDQVYEGFPGVLGVGRSEWYAPDMIKSVVEKYIEKHPEGIMVKVSPNNTAVYWVDTAWFIAREIPKRKRAKGWLIAFLIVIGVMLFVLLFDL